MSRFDRIVRRHGDPGASGAEPPARPRLNSRRKRRLATDRARRAALESLQQPVDFSPVFAAAAEELKRRVDEKILAEAVAVTPSIRDRYLERIATRAHERAVARGDQ